MLAGMREAGCARRRAPWFTELERGAPPGTTPEGATRDLTHGGLLGRKGRCELT